MELINYLAKSAAILGIFYAVYWLALRKHTFFIANRHYLIAGIVSALVLPLITLTQVVYIEQPETIAPALSKITPVLTGNITQVAQETSFNWALLVTVLYIAGVLVCIGRFAYSCWQLKRVLKHSNYKHKDGYKYVQTQQDIAPFSFFKYIVYNPNLHSSVELEMILKHEKAHAKGWHSLDVMLGQLLTIIHWINPVAWWYKRTIIQNLEFIADEHTVQRIPSKKAYQLALIQASTQGQKLTLGNSFYKSFIKKRIVMLNTNQTRNVNRWKLLLVIPLLALFMYSFNTVERVEYLETEASNFANELTQPVFTFDMWSTPKDLKRIEDYFNSNYDDVVLDFSELSWDNGKLLTYTLSIQFPESESGGGKLIDSNTQTNVIPRKISYQEGPSILVERTDDSKNYMILNYDGISIHDPEVEAEMQALRDRLYGKGTTFEQAKERSTPVKVRKESQENKDPLYVINGVATKSSELPKNTSITADGPIEVLDANDAVSRFGERAKDGAVIVSGTARLNSKPDSQQARGLTGTTPSNSSEKTTKDIVLTITKDMSKAELDRLSKEAMDKHGITLKIKDVKYDSDNKIYALELTYKKGDSQGSYQIHSDNGPIDNVFITVGEDGGIGIGNDMSQIKGRLAYARGEAAATSLARGYQARTASLASRKEAMEERKASRMQEMEARKLALQARGNARKAEMKARAETMRAQRKELAAQEKALAKTVTGYSYSTGGNQNSVVTGYRSSDQVVVYASTTNAELELLKEKLSAKNVNFTYKRVRRNEQGLITGIKLTIKNNKGSNSSTSIQSSDDEPIDEIVLEY